MSILQKLKMEIQKPNTSLQQKLLLLKALRSGKLEESEKILANLSATARTNSALYSKFHSFLAEHRTEIEDIEKDEKEEEPRIVFVEGSDDDDWATDESVSLPSEGDQDEEAPQPEEKGEKRLMRNISNTKSTTLLHSIKQVKRPFMVQTKTKQTKGLTSVVSNQSLKPRNSSSTKIQFQNRSLLTTLSKSNLLVKTLPKQASKPYFPPISGAKSTLKLIHK